MKITSRTLFNARCLIGELREGDTWFAQDDCTAREWESRAPNRAASMIEYLLEVVQLQSDNQGRVVKENFDNGTDGEVPA